MNPDAFPANQPDQPDRTDPTGLMHRYFHGILTDAETAALSRALENPVAAAQFADLSRLEAGLRDAFREDGRGALFARRLEQAEKDVPAPRPVRSWRPLAAAAAVALTGGAGLAVWQFLQAPAPVLASAPDRAPRMAPAAVPWSPARPPAPSAAEQMADTRAMRRRLREFYLPEAVASHVPLTQALSALEQQWQTLPHDEKPPPVFTVAASVSKQWKSPADQPTVSMGIRGVSALTNLNLIAAQAGLRVAITDTGATLGPDTRAVIAGEKTWTFPLEKERLRDANLLASNKARIEVIREFPYPTEFDPPSVPQNFNMSYEFPVTPSTPTSYDSTVNNDGYSIDLNLSPETLEFSPFINYGTPIDAGGVVLTESRITQPVFSTGNKSPESILTNILANHGTSVIASWNDAGNVLSAVGPVPALRTVEAVTAAARESMLSGARLEFRFIKWPAGVTPAGTTAEQMADKRGVQMASPGVLTKLNCNVTVSSEDASGDTFTTIGADVTPKRNGAEFTLDVRLLNSTRTKAEEIRRLFRMGLGYYDLGLFNEAAEQFNKILALDFTNIAARDQLKNLEAGVQKYLRATRGHPGLRMLNESDDIWVTPVPGDKTEPSAPSTEASTATLTLLPGVWAKCPASDGGMDDVSVFIRVTPASVAP